MLISGIIIGVLWLLVLTNLPLAFGITNLAEYQRNLFNLPLLLTVAYVVAIVFIFYFKDKYSEWSTTEKNPIILVDSHTQYDLIKEIAKRYHGLFLGKCIRASPLMPYKEAGSLPTTRFFLFENTENGYVTGYSLWMQNYVRKITTHLMYRNFNGRNSAMKFWYGELREEQHRGLAETTATN